MDGIPSGFKEKLGKFEEERKNPDVVFGYGVKVLVSIKGEPLTNFEISIFRQCVEEAYEIVPEEEHTLDGLERAAENLFYTRYFGITGFKEIPGIKRGDVGKDGWQKHMGEFWKSREKDKPIIPSMDDPHRYDDHYFMTSQEEAAMRKNKMELDFDKGTHERERLFEKYKAYDIYDLYDNLISFLKVKEMTGETRHALQNKMQVLANAMDSLEEIGFSGTLEQARKVVLLRVQVDKAVDVMLEVMAKFDFK